MSNAGMLIDCTLSREVAGSRHAQRTELAPVLALEHIC